MESGIKELAHKVGIAPGIVIERLQHEKLLPYDHRNHLKRSLKWDTNATDISLHSWNI
jgi:hypothetical protein